MNDDNLKRLYDKLMDIHYLIRTDRIPEARKEIDFCKTLIEKTIPHLTDCDILCDFPDKYFKKPTFSRI